MGKESIPLVDSFLKIDPVEGPDPIRGVVPVEGVDLSHEGN